MEDILGRGKIIVEIEQKVARELAKIEAEVEATKREISRDKATIELDAKIAPLEKKVRAAKDKVDEWRAEAEKAADLKLDTKKADAKLKEWEAKLKERREARDSVKLDTKQAEAALRRLQRLEEREAAADRKRINQRLKGQEQLAAANRKVAQQIEADNKKVSDQAVKDAAKMAAAEKKAQEKRAAESAKATKKRMADAEKEAQAVAKAAAAKRTAEEREAKRAADAVIREDQRATQERYRETQRTNDAIKAANQKAADDYNRDWDAALREDWKRANQRKQLETRQLTADRANQENLIQSYINAAKARAKAQRQGGRTFATKEERFTAELNTAKATRQMLELEARLRAIGRDPIEIRTKISTDGNKQAGEGITSFLSKLTSTTVRLGPFTSTIAGAVRALAVLGPAITGVVGALGALVGALGAGVVGAAGAATAGLGAFGLILGSTFLIGKRLMGGLGNLMAAQKSYNKAVQDYGKNSKEAKDKLAQLNSATANAAPAARKAFQGYQELGKSLDKVANRSKPAFFADLNQTFKTGNGLLKTFGPQMTKSFDLVSRGYQAMLKGISGKEGTRIIGTLFDNGLKALPKFGAGLANLAHAAGNVAAAFSKMLPSLGGGFEKWTQGILDVTSNSKRMEGIVKTTIGAMRSFGHFAQAAGRMLITFFGKGVGPGVSLLDRMTGGLNKMTAAMQRSNTTGNFFKDAVGTTEKLWAALKPIAQLFMEWSTIMRPFTDAMLQVLAIIGRVVSALSRFGITRGILQAAFGIFIAGTLVSKIGDVIGAVRILVGAMKSLGAIKIGGNILNALTGGGAGALGAGINKLAGRQIFGTVAKDAAAAGEQMALFSAEGAAAGAVGGKVASSAERAAGGLVKAGGAAAATEEGLAGVVGTESAFGPWGLAAAGATAAVAGAFLLLTHKSHDLQDAIKQTQDATRTYNGAIKSLPGTMTAAAQASISLSQAHMGVAQAQKEVDRLRKSGKKGTLDYKYAVDQLKQAELDEYVAQQQRKTALQQITRTQKVALRADQDRLDGTRKQLKALRDVSNPFLGRSGMMAGNNWGEVFDNVAKAARNAGTPVKDFIKNLNASADTKDHLLQLAGATDKVTAAQRAENAAAQQVAFSTLNQQRAMKGIQPIAERAASAYANLTKKLGSKTTSKLSLQFDSGGAAAKAGQLANSIASKTKGGAKYVLHVIADSKSAEETLRRLNAYKLATHKMPLTAEGKDKLISDLAQVAHYKLPVKPQKLTQQGKEALIRDLQQIIAIKFQTKTQGLNESGGSGVISMIRAIIGLNPPGKNVSINGEASGFWATMGGILGRAFSVFVNIRGRSSKMTGGIVNSAAAGKAGPPTREDRVIQRAYERAERKTPQHTRGGSYNAPTLLVGEESRKEYVIATNPAYRRSNKMYLAAAAADFGYSLVDNNRMIRGDVPLGGGSAGVYARMHSSGVVPAAKGHPGPLAKTRTKGHGKHKHQVPLKVPKRYTAGSVDPQKAKDEYTKAEGAYKTRQSNYQDAENRVHRYRHGPKGESASSRRTREHNLKLAREDAQRARNGKKGQYSLAQLRNIASNLKVRWSATQRIQDQINAYADTAESDRSIMDRNSTIYNNTGDPAALTRYNNARKDRDKQLQAIAKLIGTARANAKPKGGKRWRELDKNLNSTLNDITQNKYETAEGPAPLGIEDVINKLGLTKEYLADLNAVASARALTPTIDDNPATAANEHAASLADDLKATKALYGFYMGLYNRVKGSSMVSVQTKTDILDAITSAYSDYSGVQQDISGVSDTSGPTVDTAQVRDTARYQTMEQYGSNPQAINLKGGPQAGYSPSSPTSIAGPSYAYSGASGGAMMATPTAGIASSSFASGGTSGAGATPTSTGSKSSNVTINNTFATVPPDPHTWSAGVAFEIGGML